VRAIIFVLAIVFSLAAPAAGEIAVRLDFAGADPVITTDLGYSVRIERGHIVSFAVSLVPCSKGNRAGGAGSGLFISSARAGHVSGSLPGQLIKPVPEALHRAQPTLFGQLAPPERDYCQAHYVAAGARQLGGLSLRIEGAWRRGNSAWRQFRAESSASFGAFFALRDAAGAPYRGSVAGFQNLTLTRDLRRLFDGVRFADGAAAEMRKRILRNFVNHARVRLAP
jgi:hypothetical protein